MARPERRRRANHPQALSNVQRTKQIHNPLFPLLQTWPSGEGTHHTSLQRKHGPSFLSVSLTLSPIFALINHLFSYFQRSLQRDENHPICPFGKDCFYQHLKRDGTPFIFDHGADVCMRVRILFYSRFHSFTLEQRYHNSFPQPSTRLDYDVAHFFPSEWVPLTVNVLREAMETLESAVSASSETVVRTLNVVRLLVNRDLNNNNTEQASVKCTRSFVSSNPSQGGESFE